MTTMHRFTPILLLLTTLSCAAAKPVLRTTDDIATEACGLFFSEKTGISLEDAARGICKTKEVLQPYIDALLAAQQQAGVNAEKLGLVRPDPKAAPAP